MRMLTVLTVRKRILLLLGLLAVAFLVAVSGLHLNEERRLALLWKNAIREKGVFCDQIHNLQRPPLDSAASDSRIWNEMVKYAREPATREARAWAGQKLSAGLTTYQSSALWVVGKDRVVAFSSRTPDHPELANSPFAVPAATRVLDHVEASTFYVATPQGLLEVRGAALHADGEPPAAPARGYFFTGQFVDDQYLGQLSKLIGGRAYLVPPSSMLPNQGGLPSSPQLALQFDRILTGWDGTPAAKLRIESADPILGHLRVSAERSMGLAFAFAAALMLTLVASLQAWVSRPLSLVVSALHNGDPAVINGLRRDRTEFGELARLIRQFFEHKATLVTEIAERRRAEAALRRRDAVLEAVGFAAERVLRTPLWEECIREVLARLGETLHVGRVYLVESAGSVAVNRTAAVRFEWHAPDVSSVLTTGEGSREPAGGLPQFPRWTALLAAGEVVRSQVRDLPVAERMTLANRAAVSVLAVPIFVGSEWWGYLSIEGCQAECEWPAAEVEALQTAAGTLGAAIQRRRADERQAAVTAGLREVLSIADTLIACPDLNTLCERSVELARERLGLERCCIAVEGPDGVRGTYATDRNGHTRSLRAYWGPRIAEWSRYVREGTPEGSHWAVTHGDYWDWDGRSAQVFGAGWIAVTPIRASSMSLGAFLNDAGITGEPIDEVKQEVLAVFCSLLGNIIWRKRAEEALRESEARYRTLAETSGVGIWQIAEGGRTVYANPAMLALLELNGGELFHDRSAEQFFPPEHRPAFLAALGSDDAGAAASFETELVGAHGRRRDVVASCAPLYSADGQLDGFIGTFTDITDRKQLQQQLLHSQKMEAVGRLAGGVAHDFNNMLAVIHGYTELLLERVHADDVVQSSLEEIRKAGERAAALTRQLLAFSRKQRIAARVLDVNQVITGVESMLRRVVTNQVELTLSLHPELGGMKADQGQLEQVLFNLAINARDAMPDGGKLEIGTHAVHLTGRTLEGLPGAEPGPYVLLTVRDGGCGMDEETLAHVFEPFFTTKDAGKGTGLGLATVYGIVQQSGGHIRVDSHPGAGTTFYLYFPQVDGTTEKARSAPAAPAAPVGTETILLVEDEPLVRNLVRDVLRGSGYTVLEADCGEKGLEVYREHADSISLLVTDVLMPGMNGPELVAQIKQLRPGLPTVFMSAHSDPALNAELTRERAAFIQKPFSTAALARLIRSVLDRK